LSQAGPNAVHVTCDQLHTPVGVAVHPIPNNVSVPNLRMDVPSVRMLARV
jgi:hypothetical protein